MCQILQNIIHYLKCLLTWFMLTKIIGLWMVSLHDKPNIPIMKDADLVVSYAKLSKYTIDECFNSSFPVRYHYQIYVTNEYPSLHYLDQIQWFIFRWSGKTQRHWCCEFTLSNGQMCQTHSKIYINGCCRLCSPLGQAICFFSNSEFQNVEFFKNSGGGISIRIPWPYAFAIKNSWYLSKDVKSTKLFKISCWKGRWQWNSSRILW